MLLTDRRLPWVCRRSLECLKIGDVEALLDGLIRADSRESPDFRELFQKAKSGSLNLFLRILLFFP